MAVINERIFKRSNKNIIIRSAKINDSKELMDLIPKLSSQTNYMARVDGEFHKTIKEKEDSIREASNKEKEIFLVAIVDEKIVGALAVNSNKLYRYEHICSFGLGILREYWSIGIGKEMINIMLEWTKEIKMKKVTLEVAADNVRAIRLYEKLGFEIEGILKENHRVGDKYLDSYMMAKFNK